MTTVFKPGESIRVAWVTRSFLDYRIPVFHALDDILNQRLHLIYSAEYVPTRVDEKARHLLGDRAIGLRGEWKVGREDRHFTANANCSFRYQPGLVRLLREFKPDALVCDGFFKWTFAALIQRLRYGTPLVVLYERTAYTERQAQWFRTAYRKCVLQFTDALSCNGRLCMAYATSLGYPRQRITLGHMAADTDAMAERARCVTRSQILHLRRSWMVNVTDPRVAKCIPCPQECLVFLYVGQLIKRKGLAELLNGLHLCQNSAFSHSLSARPPHCFMLVIVGTGPEEPSLRRQVAAFGLRNVHFAGPVNYDMLAPYYAAADSFIIPTLEDNWSLVVPEAMACGLPIVCSQYNGCWPELVQKGRNGWIFDPLVPQSIVDSVRAAVFAFSPTGEDRMMSETPAQVACTNSVLPLHAMGDQSRIIVREHTPAKAASAINEACQIALRHAAKSNRRAAK